MEKVGGEEKWKWRKWDWEMKSGKSEKWRVKE